MNKIGKTYLISVCIGIALMLIQSFVAPLVALAQEVQTTSEIELWDQQDTTITYAEPPSSETVSAANLATSQSDLLCYWNTRVDEYVNEASYASNVLSEETNSAVSGDRQLYPLRDPDWNSYANIGIKDSIANLPDLEMVFVRAHYRGSMNSSESLKFTIKKNGITEKEAILNNWNQGDSWKTWEYVLQKDSSGYENLELLTEFLLEKGSSSQPKLDFFGIVYCVKDIKTEPEILAPTDNGVEALIVPTLLYRGSILVNHGTAGSALLDESGKIMGFGKLWDLGKAGQVLNRKWSVGCNPFGVTEGCYLGDKLWVSKDVAESWYHAARVVTSRCFSEAACINEIAKLEKKLAGQIAAGNAGSDKIKSTIDLLKFNQGKLAYYRQLMQNGQAIFAKIPVNLSFEMRPWELSRTYDGARYSYVLADEIGMARLRAISVPEWVSKEDAKKLWETAVYQRGAPRTIRLFIGQIEQQISMWDRWAPKLSNWSVPSIITTGGIAANMIATGVRSASTFVGEYYPYAAVTIAGSDALFDLYTYNTTESQLSLDEYLLSENIAVLALSGVNFIQRSEETVVGEGWSSLKFAIPQAKEIFHAYSGELTFFDHPEVTNYMDWRISDTSTPGQITLSKKDTPVNMIMLFKNGDNDLDVPSTTYSMVLADQNWGLVFVDFSVKVESFNASKKQATVRTTFIGFRTPEEFGRCFGWLPQSIITAKGWARSECLPLDKEVYLPLVQR